MTNIVPLPNREEEPQTCWIITTLVGDTRPLKPGDLVAWQIDYNGHWGAVIFSRWKGPTGRDENGRFVPKGSPEEYLALDCGLIYRADDTAIRILGRVIDARLDRPIRVLRPLTST
jgi:hypothetical protein